ncbi:MAG: Phosphoglycerate mutase family [Bradyrhizobium sp.]|nr:Phosphoglycerate mutase family [Bradyrhizobium sp.]
MTTHIHLVRHGHHALLDRILCGRMPGVQLDELGCDQMAISAEIIRRTAPLAVQSSPQRRALQSAAIIANRCGCVVEIAPGFDEIDMGQWTGVAFADLASDKKWRKWNEKRGSARPPGGESMTALQRRVIRHLEQLKGQSGTIVIVSHAEPIRAALMYYLRIPLSRFHSVAIDPASISTIRLDGLRGLVSCVNGEVTA